MITTSYYSKTSLTISSTFKTVYTGVKSVQEPTIMEKYPILQICRTAGFKVDWYIPKPETFCELSGEGDFELLQLTSFEKLLSFLLYLLSPVSYRDEWSSDQDTEDVLDSEGKLDSWFFVSRKVRLLKIIKTDSEINITRAYTEIFSKADTKKTTLLTHQRQV